MQVNVAELLHQAIRSALSKGKSVYIVSKNDTLTKIVRRFHTTVPELMKLNNLKDPHLHRGQKIKIPGR